MSLCTKTHLVSDAGGESPTPTHSSAAFGVRSCPAMDRPRGRLRYKAPGYVTMHASTGEARVTPHQLCNTAEVRWPRLCDLSGRTRAAHCRHTRGRMARGRSGRYGNMSS